MRQHKPSIIMLAVLATTLLVSTSASARHYYKDAYKDAAPVHCHQPLYLDDGFYIGAQGGYDSYRIRITNSFTFGGAGTIPIASVAGNPVISSNGFVGGLFAGYGIYWGDFFYIGFEAFMNGSNALQTQNFSVTTAGIGTAGGFAQVNADMSWGASFLPGLKVSDSSLLYARLGYNQSRLRGQSNVNVIGPVNSVSFNANSKQWLGGFNYGLGIETAVFPHISVRGDYNHTDYKQFTDTNASTYYPSDNQLMVSLIYHFA